MTTVQGTLASDPTTPAQTIIAPGSTAYTYGIQNGLPNLSFKQNALLTAGGSIVQAGGTAILNNNATYQAQLNNIQSQINSIRAQLDQISAQRTNGGVMYLNGGGVTKPSK